MNPVVPAHLPFVLTFFVEVAAALVVVRVVVVVPALAVEATGEPEHVPEAGLQPVPQ